MTMRNDLSAAKALFLGLNSGERTPVLAAVSGGLDSMCLLHLLTTWGQAQGLDVTAAHFNHQLRGTESDRDEAFVRSWCADHKVPFVSGRGDVKALAAERGLSTEEAAREARYAFLTEQRERLNCKFLLTAHHADDNAETMLLNLLRGTGLRGLCGIPERRDELVRPFLRVTRAELAAYAAENGIPYVEDSTNALDDAARNVLRHQVLPVLKELNPRAVEHMARTAERLRTDEDALTEAAERLLARAGTVRPGTEAVLTPEALRDEPAALVHRAVREALRRVSGRERDLTARHVEAVCGLLSGGTDGQTVSLPYGMTVRRTRNELRICRGTAERRERSLRPGETVIWGDWEVALTAGPDGTGWSLPLNGAEDLRVTAWRPADRMRLPDSRGERSLKRLCADAGIPPWERDALPVLRAGEVPAAVPEIGVDLKFLPRESPAVMYVTFHHKKEEKRYEE